MLDYIFNSHLFIRLLNAALSVDPEARAKMTPLNGHHLSMTLEPYNQTWTFTFIDGEIARSDDNTPCDIHLTGDLAGLLQLFRPVAPPPAGQKRGKLHIAGDLHAAQHFQRVMNSLQPDFESLLQHYFGEKLGAKLAAEARRLQTYGQTLKETIKMQIDDAVTSNAVSHGENEAFSARIAELQTRVQTLAKRVAKLEEKR